MNPPPYRTRDSPESADMLGVLGVGIGPLEEWGGLISCHGGEERVWLVLKQLSGYLETGGREDGVKGEGAKALSGDWKISVGVLTLVFAAGLIQSGLPMQPMRRYRRCLAAAFSGAAGLFLVGRSRQGSARSGLAGGGIGC